MSFCPVGVSLQCPAVVCVRDVRSVSLSAATGHSKPDERYGRGVVLHDRAPRRLPNESLPIHGQVLQHLARAVAGCVPGSAGKCRECDLLCVRVVQILPLLAARLLQARGTVCTSCGGTAMPPLS